LASCGKNEQFPIYDGIIKQLSDREVAKYDLVQPYFGDKLQHVNGKYYLVTGTVNTVAQWYQNLASHQQLIYVDSQIQADRQMILYDFPSNFNQKGEIDIIRVDDSTSLLILFQSIDVNDKVTGNSGWFARAWGWLMGTSGPNTFEALYGLILTWMTPISFFYQHVYLKPVLNLYLVLRALLPWYFLWIIILHSFIIAFYCDFIKVLIIEIIQRFIPQNNSSSNKFSDDGMLLQLVILFFSGFLNVLLSLAIWQTLSAFFNMSPDSRALISENRYSWIPLDMLQINLIPPDGEFLGGSFSKPNFIFIPLFVFMITILNMIINFSFLDYVNQRIKANALPRESVSDELAFRIELFQKLIEDPIELIQNVIGEALKKAAPLAFMPLGVALYFVFEETRVLYSNVPVALELISKDAQSKFLFHSVSFAYRAVKIMLVICVCWLCYSTFTSFNRTPVTDVSSQVAVSNTKLATATPALSNTSIPVYGEVSTRSLRVRAEPSTQGNVLAGLEQGQQVQVHAISLDTLWLLVEYRYQQFGWVSHEFVTITDESSLPQFDEEATRDYIATHTNTMNQSQSITETNENGLHVYSRLLTDIRAISAKAYTFLALRNDGSIIMWGKEACGNSKAPTEANISAISAGGSFCMALTSDNTLKLWGSVGSPAANPPQTRNIAKISAGYFHALALTEDGQVLAWGDNSFQQCEVPIFTAPVVDIRAGIDSSIAILNDGSAVVWGQNMAAGTYQSVRDIAPAYNHSAILFTNGTIHINGEMMGAGYEFPNSNDYIAVAADEQAQIAIRRDSTVVGVGSYSANQVNTPNNLDNIVAVATGITQSLALHSDGSVTQFGETQFLP